MKKIFGIAALAALLALPGCAKNEVSVPVTEAETQAVEVGSEAAPEETASAYAGLPNPMVPAEDPSEFESALGIKVNGEAVPEDASMYIIAGTTLDISWNKEKGENNLRATKDSEAAKSLHGIFDVNMSEPAEKEVNGVKVAYIEAKTEKYGIYSWENEGAYWSLSFPLQNDDAAKDEALNLALKICGIADEGAFTVLPLTMGFDKDNIEDGIYNADFEVSDIHADEEEPYITCDIFTEEFFDVVDVHTMAAGDSIIADGVETLIEDVREDDGGFIINGGLDSENGLVLRSNGGGTYRVFGFDDACTYTSHGKADIPVSKDVKLIDKADIETRTTHEVTGIKEAAEYIENTEWLYISHFSTTVRTEDGVIVEITVIYTP